MIDAIFVQFCAKEILDGRLSNFLSQDFFKHNKLPVFLFTDGRSTEWPIKGITDRILKRLSITESKNYEFISVKDDGVQNKTTHVFQFIINYRLEDFKEILLLETDCVIKDDAISIINSDLQEYRTEDWFIYGSYYYGNLSVIDPSHMNGVAVYNRSQYLVDFINNSIFDRNGLYRPLNYDMLLHSEFFKKFGLSKYIDSKYIINLSPYSDANIDYRLIKPESVIIHQKI